MPFASVHDLLAAVKLARSDPRARFEVPDGFAIGSAQVIALFRSGVLKRCMRGVPAMTQAQERRTLALRLDADQINDYVGKRHRRSGCRNLLRDLRMARRYPHINNQPRPQ